MTDSRIFECNTKILESLSNFINICPDAITKEMVDDICSDCAFSSEQGYRTLLAGALDIYNDKDMMQNYLQHMVKKLSVCDYAENPFYKNIKLDIESFGAWTLERKKYVPYELFVFNDLKKMPDGRILPQIGFFEEEFSYPCICQNRREWMLITPNEIETMKKPIAEAFGNVLTYGLGLGYFAYIASLKKEVKSVTVIERDKTIIELFKKHILPQFENAGKVNIIEFDALFFAAEQKRKTQKDFDFVFADIWHDPSDGTEIYRIFKTLERNDTKYSYWIEDTIKCYL